MSEPPLETQDHPRWTNIHTNIRKHMFNQQAWNLPVHPEPSAGAPIKRMLPKFKIIEYCPDVFHNLRKIFNVNTLAYRASLGTLDWDHIERDLRPAPHAHAPDFKMVGQAGIIQPSFSASRQMLSRMIGLSQTLPGNQMLSFSSRQIRCVCQTAVVIRTQCSCS